MIWHFHKWSEWWSDMFGYVQFKECNICKRRKKRYI